MPLIQERKKGKLVIQLTQLLSSNHFISFTSKQKHIYETRKLVPYINNLLQPAKFL